MISAHSAAVGDGRLGQSLVQTYALRRLMSMLACIAKACLSLDFRRE
jgi:hypothetical protein